eukprot:g29004.t1
MCETIPGELAVDVPWRLLEYEISVDQWAEGSLPRLSWCVLASQSCQALIQEQQEQKRREPGIDTEVCKTLKTNDAYLTAGL